MTRELTRKAMINYLFMSMANGVAIGVGAGLNVELNLVAVSDTTIVPEPVSPANALVPPLIVYVPVNDEVPVAMTTVLSSTFPLLVEIVRVSVPVFALRIATFPATVTLPIGRRLPEALTDPPLTPFNLKVPCTEPDSSRGLGKEVFAADATTAGCAASAMPDNNVIDSNASISGRRRFVRPIALLAF